MKFSALSTQALLASSCLVAGSVGTVAGSHVKTAVRRGLTTYADWKEQQDTQNGKPQGGGKPEKPTKEEKPAEESPEDEMEELEEEMEELEEELEELEEELEEVEEEEEAEDKDFFDAYCESVWAYDPTTGASTCFSDIEGLETKRWGWSVGPLADGPTILDIYAGAGGCDLEKGLLLGRAHVMYDAAMDELSIDFERALSMLPEDTPLEYEEVSWYVGQEPIYKNAEGKYTVAPGQFPYKESHIEGALPANAVQYDVGAVTGESEAGLYLTLHGVVCDGEALN